MKPAKPLVKIDNLSVCISVSDLDKSMQWYEEVLGFQPVVQKDFPQMNTRLAFMECNKVRIELVQPAGFQVHKRPGPPDNNNEQGICQLSFRIKNIEILRDQVKKHNIHLEWDIIQVDVLQLKAFLVRDPDGNIIEFIEEL